MLALGYTTRRNKKRRRKRATQLVIKFPLPIVSLCPNCFRFSFPRTCTRCVSRTVKLDANMLAVILWQSAQWQMKVSTRPGEVSGTRSWTALQKQVAVAWVGVE